MLDVVTTFLSGELFFKRWGAAKSGRGSAVRWDKHSLLGFEKNKNEKKKKRKISQSSVKKDQKKLIRFTWYIASNAQNRSGQLIHSQMHL